MDFARWRIFWSERRQYVQLGSFVSVIAPHHCLLLTSEVKAVKMVLNKIGFGYEKIQSESSFNLEVKIVHNAALLMFESELWHDQTQMLAQAIAEVTCMLLNIQIPVLISVRSGGVNSRLGCSFPIHIVITDLYQTTFYTYYREQYSDSSKPILYAIQLLRRKSTCEDASMSKILGTNVMLVDIHGRFMNHSFYNDPCPYV